MFSCGEDNFRISPSQYMYPQHPAGMHRRPIANERTSRRSAESASPAELRTTTVPATCKAAVPSYQQPGGDRPTGTARRPTRGLATLPRLSGWRLSHPGPAREVTAGGRMTERCGERLPRKQARPRHFDPAVRMVCPSPGPDVRVEVRALPCAVGANCDLSTLRFAFLGSGYLHSFLPPTPVTPELTMTWCQVG